MRLSTRESLIVQLLRARGFAEPSGGGGEGGSDVRVSLLPHDKGCRMVTSNELRCTCWLRSMLELERCLLDLKRREPRLWVAVRARYLLCERRPRTVQVKAGRPVQVKGQEVLGLVDRTALNHKGHGECRVLVESWDTAASEEDWLAGVRWLSANFTGALNLPSEMLSGVAA